MSNQSKLGTIQAGAYPHGITPAVVRLCRASAAYSAARAAMDAAQEHLDAARLDAARADRIMRDARRKLERVETETSGDAAAVALRPFLVPPSDAQ